MNSNIGFIGLGHMGGPMASNLQKKGFTLEVFDPVKSAVQALEKLGARPAGSITEMAANCQTILTVLPSHKEVESVVLGKGGIFDAAAPGTLVMDMSTVDPACSDLLASTLSNAGMSFVDAAIGRLATSAQRGECLFMVGARADDFERVRPLLEAMGTDIFHCGPPGSGIRTKLVNNFISITASQMNAEALTLMQRFELDLERTMEIIDGTMAGNNLLRDGFTNKVLKDDIEPGFQIDLAHKDLSLVINAANAEQVPMPVAGVVREELSAARAIGWGGKDFSALLDVRCKTIGMKQVRLQAKE